MATVIYSPIIANAETLTVNKSSSSFDLSTVDITMEEYNLLTFEERQALFDELYNLVFPSNNNARYKSSEDDPTHQAITSQAADAFINDKGFYSSDSSASIALLLTLVVYSGAPDSTSDESYKFSNYDHFHIPSTGNGLDLMSRSAADAFNEYYNKAIVAANNDDMSNAMKHLGRALHYIQDVTVPHHTVEILTVAHANYEAFCHENIANYIGDFSTVDENSYANILTQSCVSLVEGTARVSNLCYERVNNSFNQSDWDTVARRQTVSATKKTATILYKFAVDANLTLY